MVIDISNVVELPIFAELSLSEHRRFAVLLSSGGDQQNPKNGFPRVKRFKARAKTASIDSQTKEVSLAMCDECTVSQ